jgi:homoserine O-succinyltransferase
MESQRALHQDIRPIRIALCNLMPLKVVTETDIIRVLSNSPLQLELDFFYMDKHESKNTAKEHLNIFYKTFDQIKDHRYDGLIITGAPVEHLEFEQVDYWENLKEVLNGAKPMLPAPCTFAGGTSRVELPLRYSEISVR